MNNNELQHDWLIEGILPARGLTVIESEDEGSSLAAVHMISDLQDNARETWGGRKANFAHRVIRAAQGVSDPDFRTSEGIADFIDAARGKPCSLVMFEVDRTGGEPEDFEHIAQELNCAALAIVNRQNLAAIGEDVRMWADAADTLLLVSEDFGGIRDLTVLRSPDKSSKDALWRLSTLAMPDGGKNSKIVLLAWEESAGLAHA